MSNDGGRELLILGLLRRAPMSAYTVAKAVRGHSHLYPTLRTGNVYHHVEQLLQSRLLLRRSERAKRGPREQKVVYRLSSAGEKRFRLLLAATIRDLQAPDACFEIALVLLGQLPRREAAGLLRERQNAIAAHERRLARFLGDVAGRGGSAYLSGSHTLERVCFEDRWLRASIALLDDAKWSPQWSEHDGPIVDPARNLDQL